MNIGENNLAILKENVLIKEKQVKELTKSGQVFYTIAKTGMDILGGLVGTFLLIPITLVIGIYKILKKDKGSIFYTQERIGKNGKIFKMYKYRTMVPNADQLLEKYLKENKDMATEFKIHKKLRNDPRITSLGSFLRKTSIDEFPQFINVLKGEMSLVGPRPYLKREEEDMGDAYSYIIQSKPGITGLWQVSGRSNITFKDRLSLDETYEKEKCLNLDIKLILKTIIKTIKKEGAI